MRAKAESSSAIIPMRTGRLARPRTSSGLSSETAARSCFSVCTIGLARLFCPAQAEPDFQSLPPFYREPDYLHIDGWCEKTQYSRRGGVKLPRRGHQQQARRVGPQRHARKVAEPGELAPVQVPLH